MKATRKEYLKAVSGFMKSQKLSGKCLSISDNEPMFTQFFDEVLDPHFPEVDAHDMPYEDETFDCVIFNQVLEHVRNPFTCVKEGYRVLKTGGTIVLTSPFFYQVHRHPEDNWRFTVDGLRVLCDDTGFSKVVFENKAGNREMIHHMIDNPNDRYSARLHQLADKFDTQKLENNRRYYVMSSVIAIK